MTNRKWLESLSDKELARVMSAVMCEHCVYEDVLDCHANCQNGIRMWLERQHKKVNECKPLN